MGRFFSHHSPNNFSIWLIPTPINDGKLCPHLTNLFVLVLYGILPIVQSLYSVQKKQNYMPVAFLIVTAAFFSARVILLNIVTSQIGIFFPLVK